MLTPKRWLLLSITLLCLSLPQAARAAPMPQNERTVLIVHNNSDYTFCTLYVDLTSAPEWGDNLLGEGLQPHRRKVVALNPGVYDVGLLDCPIERQFVQRRIMITGSHRLELNAQNVFSIRCYELRQAGFQAANQARYDEALETLQLALTCFRSEGNRAEEGVTLNDIGFVHEHQGRYEEALAIYTQALTISREVGNRADEGAALNNIGAVYERQGRYEEALSMFEQALAISREIQNRKIEGITFNNIGAVYERQGRYAEALAIYEQALAIHQEVGNRASEGSSLNNIGAVYNSQGRYAEALSMLEKALAISREIQNRADEGIFLNSIGLVYKGQARYDEALATFKHALAIHQEIGNRASEGNALHNIGLVYDSQGRYDEALTTYEQALVIHQEIGNRPGEGGTLSGIGLVYDNQGRYDEALTTYEQALAIHQEIGDRANEGSSLSNIGAMYESHGRYDEALATYEKALAIHQEIGTRIGEASTLSNIGFVYNRQGRYDDALAAHEQALAISRAVGDRASEGAILSNLGLVYADQGLLQEALAIYEQAVDILELVRAVAGSEEARAAFIEQFDHLYARMIEASLILNRADDAFLASERGRARSFLDSLATGQVQLGESENSELLMQEREAYAARQLWQDRLAAVRALDPPNPDLEARTEQALQMAEEEYARVIAAIAARSEQLAALVPGRSQVLDLPQVQALLDEQTTLISYWTLETKSVVFVITATDYSVVLLPDASPEAISASVGNLYQWYSKENPHPRPLQELYTWLVTPLAGKLETSHVIIVPHQMLHYVPFAALSTGSEYFGEQHTLSILPSASALRFIEERASAVAATESSGTLVLGNPSTELSSLLYAEQEAVTIGALLDSAIYTGTQATEGRLWDEAADKRIIHLATHGEYNQANSLYSTIFLTPDAQHDGRLETWEIFALPLSGTDLVTLSACETNVSNVSPGDELIGLTRAFFFAGAPTVLSSLWQVNDAATEALMTSFYRHWKREGLNKAEALQAAQAEVAADSRWRSPYYWSGFVLNGHPGQ